MKKHIIEATLPGPRDEQCSAQNLRQSSPGSPLTPVGPPERLCPDTGMPLTSWTHADGSVTHFFQTDSLVLHTIPASGGSPTTVGPLPGRATAAIAIPGGICILTPGGTIICRPTTDGAWSLSPAAADYPAVAIAPSSARTYTAYTPAMTLRGTYPAWSGPLDKSDIAMLGNALLDTLRRAEADTIADGCCAAPIIAWYRLRDSAGNEIHRSVPVLVTTGGLQGPEHVDTKVSVDSGAFRHVASVPVSVTGFRISLHVNRADILAAHRHAASLELLMTPPLDLVDYTGTPYITRPSHTATEGSLRIEMPRLPRHRTILPALLDRLDELSETVAVVPDPFDPDGPLAAESPHLPDISADLSPEQAQAIILRALKRAPQATSTPGIIRETSLPHSFTAARALLAGDIVAFADITPVHALPAAPHVLWLTGNGYGAWRAKMRVSLLAADGSTEQLCSESAGEGPLPTALMPLLAYPHPGAFRIDIELTTPAGTVERSFPLTSTPASLWACHITDSLAPIDISTFAPVSSTMRPATLRQPVRHPSTMVVADATSPFSPSGCCNVGSGSVAAITEAPRSTAGLAFGRRHLYAFTSEGIHTVSVSASMRLAVSLVAREAVTSPEAVATGHDGVYAATGHGVIRMNGINATTVHPGRFAAIGYSPAFRELWCLPASGAAKPRPVIITRDGGVYTRTDILPLAFSRTASTLLVADAEGIADASVESDSPFEEIAVVWSRRICMPDAPVPRVHSMTALMAADDAEISIDLLGDNGVPKPHRFAGLSVAGEITAPLYLPVIAHPHRYVTLRLSGRVSADASITSFRMLTTKSFFL
ncbi:hypothetical protein [uncultured Muribaculum sp.]|uniref:hypothetical protein n=1 Tax=uncultured Muribaculum sp. TaxID=1918613 RepID=UPI0025F7F3E5|nr:hypothetical protein [uncultured Muribaculum sp.]